MSDRVPPLGGLYSLPNFADALYDLLVAVGEGKLTPDEANLVSAIVAKRAELFASVELASEIEALKAQLRRYCQMFSTGLSSGAREGRKTKQLDYIEMA
jgi:hypothetical protein